MGNSGSYVQPVDPDSSEIHVSSLEWATCAATPVTAWCTGSCAAGIIVQYTLVKLLWTRFSLMLGRHVREASEFSKFEICKHRESLFTFSEQDICWSKCEISLHVFQMPLFQAYISFIWFFSIVTPDSPNACGLAEISWFAMISQINGAFSDCQNSTESGGSREKNMIRVLLKLIYQRKSPGEKTFNLLMCREVRVLVEWQDRQREMIHNCTTFGKTWELFLGRDGSTIGQ